MTVTKRKTFSWSWYRLWPGDYHCMFSLLPLKLTRPTLDWIIRSLEQGCLHPRRGGCIQICSPTFASTILHLGKLRLMTCWHQIWAAGANIGTITVKPSRANKWKVALVHDLKIWIVNEAGNTTMLRSWRTKTSFKNNPKDLMFQDWQTQQALHGNKWVCWVNFSTISVISSRRNYKIKFQ